MNIYRFIHSFNQIFIRERERENFEKKRKNVQKVRSERKMSKREREEEKDVVHQEKKVKVEGELKKKDKFTFLIRRRTISAAAN